MGGGYWLGVGWVGGWVGGRLSEWSECGREEGRESE
jgi:hypothetical protein